MSELINKELDPLPGYSVRSYPVNEIRLEGKFSLLLVDIAKIATGDEEITRRFLEKTIKEFKYTYNEILKKKGLPNVN